MIFYQKFTIYNIMDENTVVLSNFPHITAQLKRRVLTGVRPFRKGGIRL